MFSPAHGSLSAQGEIMIDFSKVEVPKVLVGLVETSNDFKTGEQSAHQIAAKLFVYTMQLWPQFPRDSGPITRHNTAKSQIAMRCSDGPMLNKYFTLSFYLETADYIRRYEAHSASGNPESQA